MRRALSLAVESFRHSNLMTCSRHTALSKLLSTACSDCLFPQMLRSPYCNDNNTRAGQQASLMHSTLNANFIVTRMCVCYRFHSCLIRVKDNTHVLVSHTPDHTLKQIWLLTAIDARIKSNCLTNGESAFGVFVSCSAAAAGAVRLTSIQMIAIYIWRDRFTLRHSVCHVWS